MEREKRQLSIVSQESTTQAPTSRLSEELDLLINRAREKQRENGMQVADYIDEPETPGRPKNSVQGLTPREAKYSFEGFVGNEKLIQALQGFIKTGSSVLLTGGTGCGKTHLAIAMAKAISRPAMFVTAPDLLLQIRSTFNGEGSEDAIIRKYAGADLLILDDLGAEKSTEFSIQTLYTIISRRNREEAQTIVTTNLSLKQIAENLGDRIASRLAEMKIVKISMPDYRTKR